MLVQIAVNSKTQKDNQHLLFLGSYMSHAQLVDLKVYTDPKQDQQVKINPFFLQPVYQVYIDNEENEVR